MQSVESIESVILKERILQAVNVSSVLDNCLFHALALYFLANQLPFPEDLFTTFDDIDPDLSLLKAKFPDMDSLAFFNEYTFASAPESNLFPHHLVEKTMILGIFLRSWFRQRLSVHQENCRALFKYEGDQDLQGVGEEQITFMRLVEDYNMCRLQDIGDENAQRMASFLIQVENNPIYQANSSFFIEHRYLNEDLPDEIDEGLCKIYWENAGYANYCAYLNANVKISYSDVAIILKDLGIPYAIYSHQDATVISEYYPERQDMPVFELALHAGEGHYYLLNTERTREILDSYKSQYQFYMEEREQLIRNNSNLVARAKQRPPLFLSATLSFTDTGRSPLALVAERVQELDAFIKNPQENREQVVSVEKEVTSSVPLSEPTDSSAPKKRAGKPSEAKVSPRAATAKDFKEDAEKVKAPIKLRRQRRSSKHPTTTTTAMTEEQLAQRIEFDTQIERIKISLDLLLSKISKYERMRNLAPKNLPVDEFEAYVKKYDDAIDAVAKVHQEVSIRLAAYENNPNKKTYLTFKNKSLQTINRHKATLAQHRDEHQFYANLVFGILGLGVIYGLCVLGNYLMNGGRCTFFQTDAAQKVDRIEDEIRALTAVCA